ncbi:MAG: hypothetical protein H6741_20665 [Alphaproteobacteria bacterium]|nr:hypothetical protein [Alphaproteobacteria bacterium]MCB9795122.1 hypothetical protein [Alphaproteobacteria bacterium]
MDIAPAQERTGFGLPDIQRLFLEFLLRERAFLVLLFLSFFVVGGTYNIPEVARWVGFAFAGYAAVGNDSIQTIGTFIAANGEETWWKLWLFIGGIFVATVAWSWVAYDGDVSYGRLATKGFEQTPMEFSYLQVAAPLFLLILTRLRMPVSTTFLLLSSFATSASSVGKVLTKSLSGYVLAFVLAIVVWSLFSRLMKDRFQGEAHAAWKVLLWISSGLLWSVWIQQDAANIAVYLPRQLGLGEFVVFASVIFAGLGLLFYTRGERVQEVVNEKSEVVDVRPAAIINLVYALILYYFKVISPVPMSTTWVFLGLLGGRELAMSLRQVSGRKPGFVFGLLFKDLGYASVGLVVSIVLAASVNEPFRAEVYKLLGL